MEKLDEQTFAALKSDGFLTAEVEEPGNSEPSTDTDR
jgi:hypothetical protein